ncbi:M48 family metallopeptidase [uncultured Aquimarina sp.]|uniref:M48 family metallopeptidase n=1 Tax=uncultured Aquimarina sp. TaxID=575652 RepID=UPI0026348F36|nr:M48 family metallopeptidase [uncultured Aquimarina sp.]
MIQKEVKLSSEFKSQTTKAIASIIVFAIVYILIFLFAVALTAISVYAGIALVIQVPRFITIALGIGLASLGFLILLFLIKFLFKTNSIDRSHLTEIKQKDEPELFNLINEIVSEVGTTFPKRIYVSPEVNASVFYDSSFWSMFFPIKKNLLIGMGLVNSTHKEEFKAILSHEFGHFSQRTMKVGSYVYNVNQVIFNMLFDNESYDKMIQGWANASGYFAIFVIIAVKIIEGIQWILQKMYGFINKSYLSLSREMEFHADEIAANVTGYEPLMTSLLRMNLADHSFNSVLGFYEGKVSESIKSKNIFEEQSYIMNFYAEEDSIPIIDSLPNVTQNDLNKFNKSKLVIKDQWASHPSIDERIANLEKTNLFAINTNNISANKLFNNITQLQENLTEKLFAKVNYEKEPVFNSLESFQKSFKEDFIKNSFSKLFNGYYDVKNPIHFDLNTISNESNNLTLNELFSNSIVDLAYSEIAIENDIETISKIAYKTIKIKSFDYDGKKYHQKDSIKLMDQLKVELSNIQESLKENDISIFRFFKNKEQQPGKLQSLYTELFAYDKEYETKISLYTELSDKLHFISLTTPFDQIRSNFRAILPKEMQLKEHIKTLMSDINYTSEITDEIKLNFEAYISEDLQYFAGENYNDKNLEILFIALNNYAYLLSRGYFLLKKQLLDYKLLLID